MPLASGLAAASRWPHWWLNLCGYDYLRGPSGGFELTARGLTHSAPRRFTCRGALHVRGPRRGAVSDVMLSVSVSIESKLTVYRGKLYRTSARSYSLVDVL